MSESHPKFYGNPEIINILIKMKGNAKAYNTIANTAKALRRLDKDADLNNPEQVKQYIANMQVSDGYKKNLCVAYNKYCKHYKIQWQMPKYTPQPKFIKIPTKEKLKMIISNSTKTLAIKLTMSLECGLRPVELCNLKVKNVDLERKIIYPTTAKHGAPRTLKMSNSLTQMIQDHIVIRNLNQNDRLFKGDSKSYGKCYRRIRNRTAKKLKDPTIQTIRLYDFRHYFATMLYHRTKDILFVKQQMGHRKVETTLIYTQLLQFDNEDNYTCKVAENIKQDTELIENGFEFVTERDGLKIYRKRK